VSVFDILEKSMCLMMCTLLSLEVSSDDDKQLENEMDDE
jgi:hypothetical protein